MHPSITTFYGPPGTIKSSIPLTWPGPIAFYDLEGGGHRAWKYQEGVDSGLITPRTFNVPQHSMTTRYVKLDGYKQAWQDLTSQVEKDFKEFNTLVWDTGTMIWALDRDAMLEELQEKDQSRKQLIQIEYGEPNRRLFELFRLQQSFQKNLVITHHETDEYAPQIDPYGKPIIDSDTGKPASFATGTRVPDGFRYTLGLSDWVIRMTIKEEYNKAGVPMGTIEKSGYGWHMKGKTIDWPTYAKIEAAVQEPVDAPA